MSQHRCYFGFGRKVYVRRRRLHHGAVGVGLVAVGIALMLDDRHDWPWRFTIEM